jgi:polar amino acid transport system substrate-binding protein
MKPIVAEQTRKRGWLIFFLAAISLLSCFSTASSDQHTLILNTPGDPPYHYPKQNGILDLLIKEAFARIGMEVRLQSRPPERSLLDADQGMVDGDAVRIGGLGRQYPNLIQVPEKVLVCDFVTFSKQVALKPSGWKDLKPYNVAIIRGHKISETHIGEPRSLVKARDTEALFRLLDNDRVDLVVCERLFGTMKAKKINPRIKVLEPPLVTLDFYLYLHKRHQALIPKISEALQAMKKDGTYQKLWDLGRK